MTPRQLAALVAALLVGGLGRLVLRVGPRAGVRLVRWAAGLRYRGDPERAALRAEELAALVDERPGRLLKLLTGLGFALHALAVVGLRARSGHLRRLGAGFIKFPARILGWGLVWTLVYALMGWLYSLAPRIFTATTWVGVVALVVRMVLRVRPASELGYLVGTMVTVVTAIVVGRPAAILAGGATALVTIVVTGVRAGRRRPAVSDLDDR